MIIYYKKEDKILPISTGLDQFPIKTDQYSLLNIKVIDV